MSTEDKLEKLKETLEKVVDHTIDKVRDGVASIVGHNDSPLDEDRGSPAPPSGGGDNDSSLDG